MQKYFKITTKLQFYLLIMQLSHFHSVIGQKFTRTDAAKDFFYFWMLIFKFLFITLDINFIKSNTDILCEYSTNLFITYYFSIYLC